MPRVCLLLVTAFSASLPAVAGAPVREVSSIAYCPAKGLVAAAYRGGQVVLWEFDSARVRKVFNAAPPAVTWNKPLAQFSPDGNFLAFTQEGDAGLLAYQVDTGQSTLLVPKRLLVEGIAALNWSPASDSILVAVGRSIFLVSHGGRSRWQRRLETRALITDVAWHPSQKVYTVAVDDGEISTWEATSGRLIASARLDIGGYGVPVKVMWTDAYSLVAEVRGASLVWLDPETLKPQTVTACHCLDFAGSGTGIFAWEPPVVAVFSQAGRRARELRTPFAGDGAIAWADGGHIFTPAADSAVDLRDARSGRVIRTFTLP